MWVNPFTRRAVSGVVRAYREHFHEALFWSQQTWVRQAPIEPSNPAYRRDRPDPLRPFERSTRLLGRACGRSRGGLQGAHRAAGPRLSSLRHVSDRSAARRSSDPALSTQAKSRGNVRSLTASPPESTASPGVGAQTASLCLTRAAAVEVWYRLQETQRRARGRGTGLVSVTSPDGLAHRAGRGECIDEFW
jgi:hypothetical protein